MEDDLVQRIASHPKYQELKAKRTSFGWWLSLAGMVAYYGFILLVAFDKPLLARKLGGGVMTLGMPLGLAVIVFTIIITGSTSGAPTASSTHLTEQIVKGVAEMSFDKQTIKVLARVLAVCAVAGHRRGRLRGRRRPRARPQKQATNWTAIGMFGVFVLATLGITKWAAARTKSAADFYTAGGGITGFQNGLAIAGDYMSAASFLGISRPGVRQRFRRPDLLDRLAGRLAGHHLPDGRAAAQPGQVHLRRRRRLPLQPDADPHLRGLAARWSWWPST